MDTSLILLMVLGSLLVVASMGCEDANQAPPASTGSEGDASPANANGGMGLADALAQRRSVRSFKADALSAEQIAQLCWAAQGVTGERMGLRTAPSAGALYPLECYVVTADGVDHYDPGSNTLSRHLEGDVRGGLQAAALGQRFVGGAPATFVLCGVVTRTAAKYGPRAERYVWIEAGHAGQNILLQAVALGLGAVPVGAFDDARVAEVLQLPPDHAPLYLIPVGAAR